MQGEPLPPVESRSARLARSREEFAAELQQRRANQSPIKRLISNILGFVLLAVILVIAPFLYLLFIVLTGSFSVAGKTVQGVFDSITFLIWKLVEKFVTLVMTFGLIGGGIYYFIHTNPQFVRGVQAELRGVSQLAGTLIAMPIRYMGKLGNQLSGLISTTDNAVKNVSGDASSLLRSIDTKNLPSELAPFLSQLANTQGMNIDPGVIEGVTNLVSSGDLSTNSSAAIPVLEKALKGNDKKLSAAAYESLYKMGSKDAHKVLNDYLKEAKRYAK